ncbi:hypothetical protein OEZ85_008032 [Tetradesmus obliquus]|uniref:Sister chromatid cohesion protein n=1 Tax=Tetradesmus obliquus TaxID=3088 RepID=A0ABY8TJP5_TETOB|nr:hypothetical protein OEZ85_008032 [Tetradesmus obliquus]
MFDAAGFQMPQARLPTIVTSEINGLPFPLPAEPGQAANTSNSLVPSAAVLTAVGAALLNADIRHVRPRLPQPSFVASPGSLEQAVLHINQHAFSYAAHPHPSADVQQAAGQQQGRQKQQVQPPQQQLLQQHAAAEPGKASGTARLLPDAEKQVSAAKRRKKAAVTADEEFVGRVMDAQQVAAGVAADISSFLSKAADLQAAHAASLAAGSSSAEEAEDEQKQQPKKRRAAKAAKRAAQDGKLSQPFLPAAMLAELQASLSNAKQAGVTSQLDEEQLRQLLRALLGHVQLGIDLPLDEHDVASSATSKTVAASLEAACCCLQVLAAPGLANSLYMEELVTATVQLAKSQLQYNVLAFHDAQYKRLYRPASADDAAQQGPGKKKAKAEAAGRVPQAVGDVRAKLELMLSLLAQVVDRVLLQVELLLPLVRVSLTCMSVDHLQLLQAEAIALAVSVFRAYPQQRGTLMDEVLTTVVSNISLLGSRGPPRLYEATDAAQKPLPIMMASALVMQLVQASAQLPAMDADVEAIQSAFKLACGYCDLFWHGVFARLPAAKAAKSDGAADFKAVMEALLADLLAVQMLPEWPVATILLRRFLKMLYSEHGLKHKDTAVKLAAVEFTGVLASRLCCDVLQAEKEAEEVQALLEGAEAAADPALNLEGSRQEQVFNSLLLDYLAAAPGGNSSSTGSSGAGGARRFVCSRMLHDAIFFRGRHSDNAHLDKEALSLLLVQHRQLQDSSHLVLGPGMAELQLQRSQLVSLVRWWVVQGPLGAGRATLIKWLVEAGSRQGPDPNPATVRTKVFKCLGCVVEAESRVLSLPDVAAAVRAALDDDSVAVREATLELLAKLISTNPALAGEYFDVLVIASHDAGVSVRKRAIRSLWDCCTCPGFNRAAEAVVAVLQRAGDSEGSMRGLVTKICGEMWFLEGSSFAGLSDGATGSTNASTTGGAEAHAVRTAAVRARELADVSLKVYEAGGKAIHVPLPADHPLVVILKEVLGTGSSSGAAAGGAAAKELAVLRAGAREVADALLTGVLQQQEQDDGVGGCGQFPYLLALHALCAADASLATPRADPQRFVRCLAPYISAAVVQQGILARSNSGATSGDAAKRAAANEDASRRAAEECLCLLAVLRALLLSLGAFEQEVMPQMASDLKVLINKQRYLQMATKCYSLASGALQQPLQPTLTPNSPSAMHVAPKLLFILGQLCKQGAAVLDAAAEATPGMVSCAECLELCVALWYRPDMPNSPVGQRIRDASLQAMGQIVIGKPALMLQPLQLHLLSDQQDAAADAAAAKRVSDRGSPNHSGGEAVAPAAADAAEQQQRLPGVARCAAEVYVAALAGSHSVGIKTRVLTNLVELLRSEEAALETRQAEDVAASSSARLASTKSIEVRAPLARVNGQTDTALGTSIVQRVWKDVVRLATATGAAGSGSASCATPGGGAQVAADAAVMRRRALDVIEVVLRCGLMGPWDAGAPLVAQLTDDVPETRAAALKVLQMACQKYNEYITNLLAPGVAAAYHFQRGLWLAKHRGQPLPRSPRPEVLEGLASMYQLLVAAEYKDAKTRARFLSNLLKPFAPACSLADAEAAAREDCHKLAFLVNVAAALPLRRADEPLLLIHAVNGHVSRQAQEVLDCLRRQLSARGLRAKMGLEDDADDDADAATAAAGGDTQAAAAAAGDEQAAAAAAQKQQRRLQPPFPVELLAPLKASLCLSMLLVLKQYLMAAYSLSDERVAGFELKGAKYQGEAKALASRDKRLPEFSLGVVNLRALGDATGELLVEAFKTFRGLLDNDAANYREVSVLAALEEHEDDEAAAAAGGAAAAAAAHHAGDASHAGLVVYTVDKKAAKARTAKGSAGRGAASTGGKRGGRGGGSTGGRGRGRGGSTGRGKGRKRRKGSDSDTEDESDEEWGAAPKKELF